MNKQNSEDKIAMTDTAKTHKPNPRAAQIAAARAEEPGAIYYKSTSTCRYGHRNPWRRIATGECCECAAVRYRIARMVAKRLRAASRKQNVDAVVKTILDQAGI